MVRRAIAIVLGLALVVALSAEHGADPATAATINVACNPTALIQAIETANNETTNPGHDTLELAASCNYTLNSGYAPEGGATGLPSITTNITINGHGATITRNPSANYFRIIEVGFDGALVLNNLTVSGGRTWDGSTPFSSSGTPGYPGGGILAAGDLSLNQTTVTGNRTGNGGDAYDPFSAQDGGDGGEGGGIAVIGSAAVEINNSTISSNATGAGGFGGSAGDGGLGGPGGGLYVIAGFPGSVSVDGSTISGNSTGNGGATGDLGGRGGDGAGAFLFSQTIDITNSTISGNAAGNGGNGGTAGTGGSGGGLVVSNQVGNITNTTISHNEVGLGGSGGPAGTGEGVEFFQATTVVKNSIIAASPPGLSCGGAAPAVASANNMSNDGSCGASFAVSGSINLGPLANNGGPTLTHALQYPSAAIDAGDNAVCAAVPVNSLDQRGIIRPVDGDTTAGAICDIGAYEAPALQPGPQFTVNTIAPDNDGACHQPPGDCTLREAINAANADGFPGSEIQLGNAQTYTLTGEDNAGNGLPIISTEIAIFGNGSTVARDPGAPLFRIFQVPSPGGSLLLDNVTVSGGEATGATGDGGGIYVNGGQLNVFNSRVTGNRAAMGTTGQGGGPGRHGGGIAVTSGGSAFIIQSTINGNIAGLGGVGTELSGGPGGNGGGIALLGGTLFIDRSLISVNFAGTGRFSATGSGGAGGWGGGLYLGGGSSVEIRNTTIYSNTAGGGAVGTPGNGNGGNGGGIAVPSALTTLTNVTIASNNVGTAGGSGAVNGNGSGIYGDANGITARNMIMANGAGGNCGTGSAPAGFGSANNISTDATCGASFTQKTLAEINFGTFGNNGGPTSTLPILPGSHAIDTGSQSVCDSQFIDADQRGSMRPYDGDANGTATCDIGAFEYCPDEDIDLRCTPFDNCPSWANRSQAQPDWPIPAGDSDCDGYPDSVAQTLLAPETYIGTDPTRQCAANNTANNESNLDDAWPMDFNDNQLANGQDFLTFIYSFAQPIPGPPITVPAMGTFERERWDFTGNGIINGQDFLKYINFFAKSCSVSGN